MVTAYDVLQKEDMYDCSQPSRNLVVAPKVDGTPAASAKSQQSSLAKGGQRAGKPGYRPRHAVGKTPPQRAADPAHNLRSIATVQRTADDEMQERQLAGLNALLVLSCQTGPIPAIPASSTVSGPRTRVLGILREPALRGALALMASAIMAGVLGFVFWTLTARQYSASVLGSISAEVSSIAFLAIVGSLNLSSIFARFIPVAGWHTRRFILTSYGGAALAGLLAAVIFLVTPFAKELIIGGALGRISFALCVIINSVFNIQDGGLIGFARFTLVPVENVLVALSRLALLPLTAAFLSCIYRNLFVVGPANGSRGPSGKHLDSGPPSRTPGESTPQPSTISGVGPPNIDHFGNNGSLRCSGHVSSCTRDPPSGSKRGRLLLCSLGYRHYDWPASHQYLYFDGTRSCCSSREGRSHYPPFHGTRPAGSNYCSGGLFADASSDTFGTRTVLRPSWCPYLALGRPGNARDCRYRFLLVCLPGQAACLAGSRDQPVHECCYPGRHPDAGARRRNRERWNHLLHRSVDSCRGGFHTYCQIATSRPKRRLERCSFELSQLRPIRNRIGQSPWSLTVEHGPR